MYTLLFLSAMTISFEVGILTPNKQKHHQIYTIPGYFTPILPAFNQDISEYIIKDSTNKGQYVASKNGTKYYFTWCSGASRIKEENKIYFETKELAEAKGLEPSKTCSGL